MPRATLITQTPHKVIFNQQKKGIDAEVIYVPLQILAGESFEIWSSQEKYKGLAKKDFAVFESESSAFFKVSAEVGESNLEEVTFRSYQHIFKQLKRSNLNPVRVWNYIPDILDEDRGQPRYNWFNKGRKSAWMKAGPKDSSNQPIYPASTGIGTLGDRLNIELFASKYKVGYLQNPYQVPPLDYSKKFGPQPLFSRGALLFDPNGTKLFVSATASIVGEENVYLNNPKKQTIQVLENIQNLISEKNCQQYGYDLGFSLDNFNQIRVYIKNLADFEIIRKIVEKFLGRKMKVIYLQADISRDQLLVE